VSCRFFYEAVQNHNALTYKRAVEGTPNTLPRLGARLKQALTHGAGVWHA
jgi:hypothetical protein